MSRLVTSLRRLALVSMVAFAGNAAAIGITREFSASWFDPGHAGHGFSLEVVSGAQGKTLVVYWFTFDTNGKPLWVAGAGPVAGDRATVRVAASEGGTFDNAFRPGSVTTRPWGTLEFSFTSCNDGNVRFTPDDASLPRGSMPIKRLTSLYNASCSGGISDDRGSGSDDQRIVQFLQSSVAGASGKVEFEQRSTSTAFKVEIEDVPAGRYTVRVGGTDRGTLDVTGVAGSRRGEREWRSPADAGHSLLVFDPRGQRVDVVSGNTVVLSTALGTGANTGGGTGLPAISGRYVMRVETHDDGPELEAELEGGSGRTKFSVEAEDVPVGSYGVRVGGTERGVLTVRAVPGGTNGELEFRTPAEPGKVLLDFDPRGQLVELTRNGSVISGLFPTTPTTNGGGNGGGGDDNGGDDNGGGGNDDGPGDDNGGHGGDDDGDDDHGGHGGDDDGDDDHGGHGGHGGDD